MKKIVIYSIVAIVVLAVIGGYFLLSPSNQEPTFGIKSEAGNGLFKSETTSKTPFELALTVDALPEGFKLKDKVPRVKSEVSGHGLSLGWKDGYYVSFIKGESVFDATLIEQYISVYPIENITLALITLESDENVTYDSLTIEKIGDGSKAYKVKAKDEFSEETTYIIEFYKKDVFMRLAVSGLEQNYDILKELAKEAASKI